MDLYKVLLVDDEEDIRVGISRKMDWSGLGFELVGEAENGRDALELAESVQPDVVLTDIKMPFMDGLELCSILTKRLPGSKFVVFSGFDDFEYAKQAVRMNVSEYILKPINAPELCGVLRKLKDQLDTERARRQDLETLRRRGWPVQPARNDVLAGIRVTAGLLKSGRLVICPPCRDAIREFFLYRWDETAAGDRVKKCHDHAMDDIRYFAATVAAGTEDCLDGFCVERGRF